MKPIKIVYNWIGPNGPIWNTELPNVLSFASTAPNTTVNSHFWFADDAWYRVFNPLGKKFELASVFGITPEDTFIYPLSINWRTQFQNYFYIPDGILEFSHTQQNIIHAVRSGQGYIYLDMNAEAWVEDEHLHCLHEYFSDYHRIPLFKIFYITGCMNASKLYKSFLLRNKFSTDPRDMIQIIGYPGCQSVYADEIKKWTIQIPTYDINFVPEKLFLVWNRRFKPHRIGLSLALSKLGLLDRSYLSMSYVHPEIPRETIFNHLDIHAYPQLEITNEDVQTFVKKLPLVLDGETNTAKMCADFDLKTRKFYKNSLISIVTETNFEQRAMSFTEKSLKPMKEKHPFIIVGVNGILQVLRDLGFKTFSDYWDESYDEIENPKARMFEIIKICNEIGKWDTNKILEFRKSVKPILEHNFELIKQDLGLLVTENIYNNIRGMYPE